MANIIVFGDSIACGQNDPRGGWVEYLRQSLNKDLVYNLGIDGETTTGLVNRLEKEIKPRLSEDDLNIVVMAIGVNDSAWNHQQNDCWIPLEQFKSNLLQLVKQAKNYTQKIILVGPAPVDQVKVDPVPWHPELSYKTDLVKQYSQAMKAVSVQVKVKFVDLFNRLPPNYLQTLDDGLHPNHAGHQKIFTLVQNFIK